MLNFQLFLLGINSMALLSSLQKGDVIFTTLAAVGVIAGMVTINNLLSGG